MVNNYVAGTLDVLGIKGVKVTISQMENANLIGAAMAVLS